ncbi:zinc ribbon domain-containing protein [Methanolobus sp. ZRKC5]|uniref:zinc ribbon domain-containing protein n=1 Tax=unclassified Methanolobus TaxID=2629569 RepID=UPI00313D97A6
MPLKWSYFDPRDNLRIGIYIGLFFGLGGGFPRIIASGMIGFILAAITAYIVPKVISGNAKNEQTEDSILPHAIFTGVIIAIFGALVFSSFEPVPLIAIFVCPLVSLRSGSRVRTAIKEMNAEKEIKRIKKLEHEKQINEALNIAIDIQQPLKAETENPVKVTIINPSDIPITNVSIRAECSRLVRCEENVVSIDVINAESSGYTAIFLYPRLPDNIDLGKIYVSYLVNGNYYKKEPIDIGIYEVSKGSPVMDSNNPELRTQIQVFRETEFYQGFVRLKMSVNNVSALVVNDVALDFDFDEHLFRIDRFEPMYSAKNDKLLLGNIEGNNSKSVMIYFDPLICSKSSEIKCRIFYKDAKGKLQNTEMETKRIAVTCPIMKTNSNINIGMLRELLAALPFRDSKVYHIKSDFDIVTLMNMCREMVQHHDIRHVRTLRNKDGNHYETWYYGNTKVNDHDIILKITISGDTGSIELFGATQTAESLVGMLAEFGRELCREMKSSLNGKNDVKQIVNVTIKDSIIQRSNLLNSCDLNGNCEDNVIVEDSVIQKSEFMVNYCPSCGSKISQGANFCSECGMKIT